MQTANKHHGVRSEEAVNAQLRIETQKILDHAAALAAALDLAHKAKWGLKPEWMDFIADIDELAMGLDKLGDGKLASARRVRDLLSRNEPARSPEDVDNLHVRMIPATDAPNHPEKYMVLGKILEKAELYAPVRILDAHMGITALTRTPASARRNFYHQMAFSNFDVKLYIYVHGGPHPSTAYVWRSVACDRST